MAKLSNRQKRFATTALTFCAVYLSLFSIAQYISFLITGVEQERLIEQTFLVIGIEVGMLLVKRIVEKIFPKKNTDGDE